MAERIFHHAVPDAKSLFSLIKNDLQMLPDNEIFSVKFQEQREGKPLYTERGLPMFESTDVSYLDLVEEFRVANMKKFVTFDNIMRKRAVPTSSFEVHRVMLTWSSPRSVHFLGEEILPNQRVISSMSKICATGKCYIPDLDELAEVFVPFDTKKQANEFAKSMKNVEGKVLLITGMQTPYFETASSKVGRMVEERARIFVNDYDVFNDSFKDLDFLQSITSYDDLAIFREYGKGNALFDAEVNTLMWFNAMYYKPGDPVFNLIISGPPSIAKTSCLRLYQSIFGDPGTKVFQAEGSTVKGLLPSFSEPVRPGALIDARFFIGVDEFFRSATSDAQSKGMKDTTQQIQAFMSKLLGVISRGDETYSSGKGSIDDEMTAALMATDNLTAQTRHALQEAVEGDPAILRRFMIVWLGTKTEWQNIEQATVRPSQRELVPMCQKFWKEKYNYDVTKLKRLAEWARSKIPKVVVDYSKTQKLGDELVRELLTELMAKEGRVPDDDFIKEILRKVVIRVHVEGAVVCACITRHIINAKKRLPTSFTVDDEDYIVAKNVLRRPLHDMFEIFKDALENSTRKIGRIN